MLKAYHMTRDKVGTLSVGTIIGAILTVALRLFYSAVVEPPLPTPEQWFVIKAGEVIDAPKVVAVAESLEHGKYEVLGFPKSGKLTQKVITIGDNVTPVPTPPEPPKPEPPKPPEPVEVGKRVVVIVRETSGTSITAQTLFVGLRTGTAEKYLTEKGHRLHAIDFDSTNEKNDTALQASWREQVQGLKLPVVIVCKETAKGVITPIAKREIKADETPDNIIEYIRQNGG